MGKIIELFLIFIGAICWTFITPMIFMIIWVIGMCITIMLSIMKKECVVKSILDFSESFGISLTNTMKDIRTKYFKLD